MTTNRAPHPDEIIAMMDAWGIEHNVAKRILRKGEQVVPVRFNNNWSAIKRMRSQGIRLGKHYNIGAGHVFLFRDKSLATMMKMQENL